MCKLNICTTDSINSTTATAASCHFQGVHTHNSRDTAASATTTDQVSPTSKRSLCVISDQWVSQGTQQNTSVIIYDQVPGTSRHVLLVIRPTKNFNPPSVASGLPNISKTIMEVLVQKKQANTKNILHSYNHTKFEWVRMSECSSE